MAVCKLDDYLFALAQNGEVLVYDEPTRFPRQDLLKELTGVGCMCKCGQEMYFGRGKEVECWRVEERGIDRVRSIQTIEKVNHLLALDHRTVLAAQDFGHLQVLKDKLSNDQKI